MLPESFTRFDDARLALECGWRWMDLPEGGALLVPPPDDEGTCLFYDPDDGPFQLVPRYPDWMREREQHDDA